MPTAARGLCLGSAGAAAAAARRPLRTLLDNQLACSVPAAMAQAMPRPYQLTVLPTVGAEVHGIDLKEQQPATTVAAIKEDVLR